MAYLLVFVILAGFAALYFLVRERLEVIEKEIIDPQKEQQIQFEIRKKLLKRYLAQSKNISLRSYQLLTGVSLEEAVRDLERFAEAGFLFRFGEQGQTIYYDPRSSYNQQEIKSQINRRMSNEEKY